MKPKPTWDSTEIKKNFGYIIHDTFSLEEGLELLREMKRKPKWDRKQVLVELAEKDTKCVCCGVVGTKFCKGEHRTMHSIHWDLYTDDDIAMTIDHIVPRAQGGADKAENCQLMCMKCNNIKGHLMEVYIAYKYLLDRGIEAVVERHKHGVKFIIGEGQTIPYELYKPIRYILRVDFQECYHWYDVREFYNVTHLDGTKLRVACHQDKDYVFTDLDGNDYIMRELQGLPEKFDCSTIEVL